MELRQEIMNRATAHAATAQRLGRHVTALMIVILTLMVVSLGAIAFGNKSIAMWATIIQFSFLTLQSIVAFIAARHYKKAEKLLDQARDLLVSGESES